MSSTLRYQQMGVKGDVRRAFSSRSVMYISVSMGESGEPMGSPCICWNSSLPQVKYVELMQADVRLMMDSFERFVSSGSLSFFSRSLRAWRASSRGTLVNRSTTS